MSLLPPSYGVVRPCNIPAIATIPHQACVPTEPLSPSLTHTSTHSLTRTSTHSLTHTATSLRCTVSLVCIDSSRLAPHILNLPYLPPRVGDSRAVLGAAHDQLRRELTVPELPSGLQ